VEEEVEEEEEVEVEEELDGALAPLFLLVRASVSNEKKGPNVDSNLFPRGSSDAKVAAW
jgi:hypothetical protein